VALPSASVAVRLSCAQLSVLPTAGLSARNCAIHSSMSSTVLMIAPSPLLSSSGVRPRRHPPVTVGTCSVAMRGRICMSLGAHSVSRMPSGSNSRVFMKLSKGTPLPRSMANDNSV